MPPPFQMYKGNINIWKMETTSQTISGETQKIFTMLNYTLIAHTGHLDQYEHLFHKLKIL